MEKRLGKPRILDNIYFKEAYDWIQDRFKDNPDSFSYFEAGCGHGNDLRAIKEKLDGKGRFLGVDLSEAELTHGLNFYQSEENTEEARKLFAQGNLRDLRNVNTWNDEKKDFSQPTEIKDGEFDLIYIEAVLQGLGHGQKTYREKKASAQQMLNELSRICKSGGKFFGRTSTFNSVTDKNQQFQILRNSNNWRFIPEARELEKMLKSAGFTDVQKTLVPHEETEIKPSKKYILRMSFLAQK